MPPADGLRLAQAPAEPDGSAVGECREVDETRADIAQGHVPRIEPDDGVAHPRHQGLDSCGTRGDLAGMVGTAVGRGPELLVLLGKRDGIAVGAELLQEHLDVG